MATIMTYILNVMFGMVKVVVVWLRQLSMNQRREVERPRWPPLPARGSADRLEEGVGLLVFVDMFAKAGLVFVEEQLPGDFNRAAGVSTPV